jgi:hypothetical protein
VSNMATLLQDTFNRLSMGQNSPLLLGQLTGLLYKPGMIDGDDCGAVGGMNGWQGKPKYS